MKAFSTAVWGMGTTVVYLLEDRIEVGVISSGFSEELKRLAYRDITAVVCWPSRRPRFLFLGWTFLAIGLAFSVAGIAASGGAEAAVALLLFGALFALAGGFFLFYGRLGAALEFRVDGPRSSVRGVVVGKKPRHRFVDELVARIEERRRR